jgi:hypothetical protein
MHQMLRDTFSLMLDVDVDRTDVLEVGMVLFEMQSYAKEHGVTFSDVLYLFNKNN